MSGDVKITGCVSGSPCPYKLLGGTISECGYWGNCIYKRPQELKEAIPNDGKMPLFDRMVRQRDADMKVLEEKVQQVRVKAYQEGFDKGKLSLSDDYTVQVQQVRREFAEECIKIVNQTRLKKQNHKGICATCNMAGKESDDST